MSNKTKTATKQDEVTVNAVTTSHGYPTFPTSGPKTHLGQIGHAFEDIGNRIDNVNKALADKADASAIPGNATASKAGLMSAKDKTKLDELQNYVLPAATANALGGVKVGAGLQIQDGKLTTSMNKASFVPDPAGDTVTKEEFIALRNALVTAGIMMPQA